MTKQRYDEHSTEFGLWLRNQPSIDSKIGYTASNIDYLWLCYKSGLWMFIEEKRHGRQPDWSQNQSFAILDRACKSDPKYKGFHVLVFEETNPDDGKMYWDGHLISKETLIDILKMENEGRKNAWESE